MSPQVVGTQTSQAFDGFMRGSIEFLTDDRNIVERLRHSLPDLAPGKVIVKCKHCGQYAARKTACVHCGAPVD